MALNAITAKVSSKRAELDAAKLRVEILSAELRVWEEADAMFRRLSAVAVPGTSSTKPAHVESFKLEPSVYGGQRTMKGSWRAIMQSVASMFPAHFSLDDLEEAAKMAGHPVNRNTARSQMSNYASVGLVERIQQGQFRITHQGLAAAGSLSVASAHVEPNTKSPTADDVQAVRGSSAQSVTAPEASED